LARTGSIVGLGRGAFEVAVVGAVEPVEVELDGGVVTTGPGSEPVHAASVASTTGATAYES
jgi:hypothetical protein